MKIQGYTVLKSLLLALALGACRKEYREGETGGLGKAPILFQAGGVRMTAQSVTKAGMVDGSSLARDGFRVSATVGSAPEREVWTNAWFSQSGDVFRGDKWWPLDQLSYHFYASNASLSYTSAGNIVTVYNTTDIVCAYLASPVFKSLNSLQFNHIFACLGDVTVSAVEGYTITDIQMVIIPRIGGTYNLKAGNGHTDGTGWSNISEGPVIQLAGDVPGTQENDLLLVPGEYTVSLSWTATSTGGASDHYSVNTRMNLSAGRRSSVSCTLGGAPEVTLGVSLASFEEVDWVDDPACLSFYAVEAGTISWKCSKAALAKTIEYSKNFGRSWTSLTSTTGGASFSVNAGDVVWVRGNETAYGASSGYNFFSFSGKTYVYGDISSLLSGDGMAVADYAFYSLFTMNDYLDMHPRKRLKLPATAVGDYGYANLFSFCRSLKTAPELPATTLGRYCYSSMFDHCSSLINVPERLPATVLAERCYENMFINCTSLTHGPVLPATTLKAYCYHSMFQNCYSLESAPDLPALTLVTGCYNQMFYSCDRLSRVKALFLTTPGSSYTQNWMYSVGNSGTFVKNGNASWNVRGNSGVPSSWTIETE